MKPSRMFFGDTGEAKLDSLAVKAEMNLEPCTRYYWKVIVTTDADEVLESDVQFFETAKRDEPWVGKWITCDSRMERHPIFSKRIIPRGKVKKARLYLCGLGLYEAYFYGWRENRNRYFKIRENWGRISDPVLQ